jgi:hypothetical protein
VILFNGLNLIFAATILGFKLRALRTSRAR